ncbi:MAG TPA: hypothetical protein VMF86_18500 [Stellaceae bacterium]|nr:hypothetical protein [Stellaceae bacterium]
MIDIKHLPVGAADQRMVEGTDLDSAEGAEVETRQDFFGSGDRQVDN